MRKQQITNTIYGVDKKESLYSAAENVKEPGTVQICVKVPQKLKLDLPS